MIALLIGVVACLQLPAPTRSQASTQVGFENLPVGTRVDAQYLSLGLRVSSLAAIDTTPRAHAGKQLLVALALPTAVAMVPPRQLVLGFPKPQSFVSLYLTGRPRGRLVGTVRAFDAAGVLLAVDGPRPVYPPMAAVQFAVRAPDARIAVVQIAVIDSTPNGSRPVAAAIDDLEFGVTPPPVPSQQPILVPDLHGLSPRAAAETLQRVRLVLGAPHESMTRQFPANTIIDQKPGPGTPAKPGDSISVLVARAPRPPPPAAPVTPPVTGTTQPPPPPPSPPVLLIVAIVAGLVLGGFAVQRGLRHLRWRIKTQVHTGLESLRTRLAPSREPSLEIRFVPVPSPGTQRLRKGS